LGGISEGLVDIHVRAESREADISDSRVLQSENTSFYGKILRVYILIFFITKFTSFDCKRYLQKSPT